RTYGSVFRNRAMALETLVILGDSRQRELSVSLAKNLSSQNWYSTQETAYALLALSKMVVGSGGKSIDLAFTHNGMETVVKTDRALAQRELAITSSKEQIQVHNKQGNTVYVTLTQTGKLPVGQELALQRNLNLSVSYRMSKAMSSMCPGSDRALSSKRRSLYSIHPMTFWRTWPWPI